MCWRDTCKIDKSGETGGFLRKMLNKCYLNIFSMNIGVLFVVNIVVVNYINYLKISYIFQQLIVGLCRITKKLNLKVSESIKSIGKTLKTLV